MCVWELFWPLGAGAACPGSLTRLGAWFVQALLLWGTGVTGPGGHPQPGCPRSNTVSRGCCPFPYLGPTGPPGFGMHPTRAETGAAPLGQSGPGIQGGQLHLQTHLCRNYSTSLGEFIYLKLASSGEFITILADLGWWSVILGHFSGWTCTGASCLF